jgi:glutathione S-transferase
MADDFTLYIDTPFLSPYAMSAFVALTEKGVPFQLRKVDLAAREHTEPHYAALSRTRRIPTLTQGAFRLSESSAIAEYLEDVLPPPQHYRLYPPDPRHRATARQIQGWLRSDLMPIREERSTEFVFLEPPRKKLSKEGTAAAATLFEAVESWLPPGADYLFDEWCIADTDLALMLNRLVLAGDPVPARLAGYARHQWERPSVQTWVTQARQAAGLGSDPRPA